MTMKVLVGSQTLATVMELEVIARTPIDAQRHAVTVARGLHHIPDPVALRDDHRSAKLVRSIAERIFREQVIAAMRAWPMNGTSGMCFDNRYEPYQFN